MEVLLWVLAAVTAVGLFYLTGLPDKLGIASQLVGFGVITVVGLVIRWLTPRVQVGKAVQRRALLLSCITTFALGVLSGFLIGRLGVSRSDTLVFISPVHFISRQSFYARVLEELASQGREKGFEVTLWLPEHDFSIPDQMTLLKKAAGEQRRYAAAIFVPFKLATQQDEQALLGILAEMSKLKLIVFDTDLSDRLRQEISDHGLPVPPCVRGNETMGGQLAAAAMVHFFRLHGKLAPVIAAFDSNPSADRVRAFQDTLRAQTSGLAPTLLTFGLSEFSRSEAKDFVLRKLSEGQHIDAFFGANDTAALGVRDAILQLRAQNLPIARSDIRVVGYDGIEEALQLLQSGSETIFLTTINADVPEQVRTIIADADQLRSRGKTVFRSYREPCKLINPLVQ